jgi:hypothetical protein
MKFVLLAVLGFTAVITDKPHVIIAKAPPKNNLLVGKVIAGGIGYEIGKHAGK